MDEPPRTAQVGVALAALLAVIAILSLTHGAMSVAPSRVFDILFRSGAYGAGDIGRDALVVLNIRLPRLLLGAMIGSALGGSGALMQGLFRNPLADPGLVGVSAGAGLAAAATIVLGEKLPAGLTGGSSFSLLPAAAFLGALASTAFLYAVTTRGGRTSIATMLLAGVALAALAGSLTGLLAYVSDDRQLRDLTFWSMGSLGGATWAKVEVLAPVCVLLVAVAPFLSRGLNAMALGEAEAFHLGVRVQRLKIAIILLVAIAVGASVAAAGVIGFVGIVAPHLLRLAIGPDHRALLPLSAVAGATLMAGADILARTLVAPAEMPIGILTAAIGAPFFLWLLLRGDWSLRS
ncbi:iron ABC transporter permease [Methylocapsa sp. S129]|uniref:FecCD family ABC transporter permease n=1 Tax=Methylocapsa sp. S129 TaxID=1641869 RepID=UPI00131B1A9A|nr:iron ABC transporter permease [Methylocapsa sp. S129]